MKLRALPLILTGFFLLSCSLVSGVTPVTESPSATPDTVESTSQPDATPTDTPISPDPTLQSGKTWTYKDMTVAFLQSGADGGWRLANTESFKSTALDLGIELKYHNAGNDLTKQRNAFAKYVEDPDVDVIILAAVHSEGWTASLEQAKAAGKIVVLEEGYVNAPEDLYATYVGPDFVEEGRKSAVLMCELLEGIPSKNVVELVGSLDASAAIDRGKGFRSAMGNCGITITQSDTASWGFNTGKEVMAAMLRKNRDIQGLFAQNDSMALGAIEAIKAAGLKPGIDIKIVSIDGVREAFAAMLKGELNASVECSPWIGPQALEAALKALNGETLPKWIPSLDEIFRSTDPDLEEIAKDRVY